MKINKKGILLQDTFFITCWRERLRVISTSFMMLCANPADVSAT